VSITSNKFYISLSLSIHSSTWFCFSGDPSTLLYMSYYTKR
jgi:hypothetical protein